MTKRMRRRLEAGDYMGESVRASEVGRFLLNETTYAPGTKIAPHRHEHAYLCLIRRGSYAERISARESRDCYPLTVAFHPPGEHHQQEMHNERVVSFNVEIPRGWITETLPSMPGWAAKRGTRASWIASALYDDFREQDELDPIVVESRLLDIFSECDPNRTRITRRPGWLDGVLNQLSAEMGETLSIVALAELAGVHPVYLASEFRRHVGASIGEHRRRLRVTQASQQLVDDTKPLVDIALGAGFFDQAHFCRTFKRYTGLTPRRFRSIYAATTPP